MYCMMDLAKRHCVATSGFVVLASLAAYSAVVNVQSWNRKKKLQEKATAKKALENKIIKEELSRLQPDNDEEEKDRYKILGMSAKQLIQAAQSGELDPVQILRAFMHKACSVTQKFNSVTCIIQKAEEDAKQLIKVDDKNAYPLYGLPVSIKECCDIQGMDSTMGLVNSIGKPAIEDCVLAKVLKHKGGVPFVKTNLPQLTFSFESSNPVYGETGNAHNVDFTPGGSSSGEGSLIASGGSFLGFGTDTGGSIRVPSHMSGICGLKPTLNRLSIVGLENILPGSNCVTTSVGPMASDVDTLVLAMRALLCPLMFDLDHTVPRMPFNDEMYSCKKRLRVGYYSDDGYVEPVPAIRRAVSEAKRALEKAGHELIPFKVPKMQEAMIILTSCFFADAGEFNIGRLKSDLIDKRLEEMFKLWTSSDIKCKILSLFKSKRLGQDLILHKGGDRSTTRLWALGRQAAAFANEYMTEWNNLKLDVLICPPYPLVACPKGSITHATSLASYTGLYNLLNFPAGVVPVTKVTQKDIDALNHFTGHYGDAWDKHNKEVTKGSIGMPVGVQCVAPTWKDELCLKLMRELETQMKQAN